MEGDSQLMGKIERAERMQVKGGRSTLKYPVRQMLSVALRFVGQSHQ